MKAIVNKAFKVLYRQSVSELKSILELQNCKLHQRVNKLHFRILINYKQQKINLAREKEKPKFLKLGLNNLNKYKSIN